VIVGRRLLRSTKKKKHAVEEIVFFSFAVFAMIFIFSNLDLPSMNLLMTLKMMYTNPANTRAISNWISADINDVEIESPNCSISH
jgi:hypothetical protein